MSTRAVIVMLVVAGVVAQLANVLFTRVGYWAFLLPVVIGPALGPALAEWDIRSGKQGWFS